MERNITPQIKSMWQKLIQELKSNIDDWNEISKYEYLPEYFIDCYHDKVNWHLICTYQKLSQPLMEKYQEKLYWGIICHTQKLSEEFMDKHQDKINKISWVRISWYQHMSKEFIIKHIDKLNVAKMMDNDLIEQPFDEELMVLFKLRGDL